MISIIMPVYNTGSILEKSIQSILKQTYKNFELICINDCSSDEKTLELLKEFKLLDCRITVIDLQKNMGAGEARNVGISKAASEYIIFLDADDYFDERMLDVMIYSIKTYNADICICAHCEFSTSNGNIISAVYPKQLDHITEGTFKLSDLPEAGLQYWYGVPWNKLIKKELIINNGIYFQSLKSSNDVFFSFLCNLCADKIVYCIENEPMVFYSINSTNQISSNRDPFCFFKAMELLIKTREAVSDAHEKSQIYYSLIEGSISELKRCKDEALRKEYYDFIGDYLSKDKNIIIGNLKVQNHKNYIIDHDYSKTWIDLIGDFHAQLEYNREKIEESLCGYKNIILWGNGERGKAFQSYYKKYGTAYIYVTEKSNKHIGTFTELGYEIISSKQAMSDADLIIASNTDIYDYLCEMNETKTIKIINLEEFCSLV